MTLLIKVADALALIRGGRPMTGKQKTILSYVIAVGVTLVAIAIGAAIVRWPEPVLEILGACAAVYLFHGLAKLVRECL
jgi:hypothetical protein